MSITVDTLSADAMAWLKDTASVRGVSIEAEAARVLGEAIASRRRIDASLDAIRAVRVHPRSGPVDAIAIEAAISWGRD